MTQRLRAALYRATTAIADWLEEGLDGCHCPCDCPCDCYDKPEDNEPAEEPDPDRFTINRWGGLANAGRINITLHYPNPDCHVFTTVAPSFKGLRRASSPRHRAKTPNKETNK